MGKSEHEKRLSEFKENRPEFNYIESQEPFVPEDFGFIIGSVLDNPPNYLLMRNHKLKYVLSHRNYWILSRVIEKVQGEKVKDIIYKGQIPNKQFAKELFINLGME